ncbi:MAG: ATP-binding protein [Trueperaceae bacterium]|nr:ATP-binding protein [Trueperaceae bacterium]MCW5820109.1 ATP-binding protein [Trueperaceae bacterium]
MDFERLGVFYLGREVEAADMQPTDQALLYDSSDLTTHAVIVGMTGSGKTGLGVDLIEEAAIDGIPVLAIDPKGDLTNLALAFPNLAPEDFEPWVNAREAERLGVSVREYAAQQAQAWRDGLAQWDQDGTRIERLRQAADVVVYTPGSSAGRGISVLRSFAAPPRAVLDDPDLMRDRLEATATSVLTLMGGSADPLGREHILLSNIFEHAWRAGTDLDVAGLIHAVQQPPFKQLGVMDLDTVFPAKDRLKLALGLNGLLAAPTFAAWTTGDPLNIEALLHGPDGKARVAVVSIAHLSDAERMFFLTLLLSETVAWTRSQSGTSSLRAMVYIDELFGFLPPVAEPPSKKPLLTLLKQARAFGVGLALATQNPVDLDYKALSNAGTWFVGRLQTERDKQRLAEGLNAASEGALSVTEIADIIGRLPKRTFLLHDVHAKRPAVFQTRWAMSYLAGPLTRDQIRLLGERGLGQAPGAAGGRLAGGSALPVGTGEASNGAPVTVAGGGSQGGAVGTTGRSPEASRNSTGAAIAKPAGGASTGSPGATSAAPAAAVPPGARPFLPPHVPQVFLSARVATGARYFPMALGVADVHYESKSQNVSTDRRFVRLADFREGMVAIEFAEGEAADVALESLEREPAPGLAFDALPDTDTSAAAVKRWQDGFMRWLRTDGALTLLRHKDLKLVAAPDESEQQFRLRCSQALREQRDAALDKVRKRYESKLTTLQRRELQKEQAVQRETQQAGARTTDAAVTVGTAILGALFGRKAPSTSKIGTSINKGTRVFQDRGDVARAKEALAQTQAEMAALEAEMQSELAAVSAAPVQAEAIQLDTVSVAPTARDIAVRYVGVAWVPYLQGADGRWNVRA